MRAVNRAGLEGNWSDPEILNITDIPPPTSISAQQVGVAELLADNSTQNESAEIPMFNTVSFRITLDVTWMLSFLPPPPPSRKRQAFLGSEMPVTRYTIVVGMEEIMDSFGSLPEDSFEQDVSVSYASDTCESLYVVTMIMILSERNCNRSYGSW